MIFLKRNIVFILVLWQGLLAQTQELKVTDTLQASWIFKTGLQSAFIIAHRSTMEHLVTGYPSQWELTCLNTRSRHFSDSNFSVAPRWGISFTASNLKNPSALGYAYSISPVFDFRLNPYRKTPSMLQASFGMAYITKYWDLVSNNKNNAIGTPLNGYVRLRWYYRLQVLKHWHVEPGITFSHMSNGRYKNPNLGINLLGVQTVVFYHSSPFDKPQIVRSKQSKSRSISRYEIQTIASVGLNQEKLNQSLKTVGQWGWSIQRRVKNNAWGLGIDLYFDQQYQDLLSQNGLVRNSLDLWRSAAFLGYTFHAGPISFPLEIGYYFFQRTLADEPIVNRLGVRYTTPRNIILHWAIRAHYAVAYNFEFGLGYCFNKQNFKKH